jgi:hypothetical protein
MEKAELEKRFTYHNPNPEQTQKLENIRKNMKWLAELLDEMCPESREKSLALTQLEQAQFWANASIVRSENPK